MGTLYTSVFSSDIRLIFKYEKSIKIYDGVCTILRAKYVLSKRNVIPDRMSHYDDQHAGEKNAHGKIVASASLVSCLNSTRNLIHETRLESIKTVIAN